MIPQSEKPQSRMVPQLAAYIARQPWLALLTERAGRSGHWLACLWQRLTVRLREDRLAQMAGHLAYTSLLSLVPLLTVALSIFSAFPAFAEARVQIELFVFSNFMPAAGEVVQEYIHQFVANAGQVTTVGVLILAVTALLLISEIDTMLNRIWRSKHKRRKLMSFAIYWMVLTLGPVMLGASMAVSNWLLALLEQQVSGARVFIFANLPFLATLVVFTFIYALVPTATVRLHHALLGAIFTGLMFELAKWGFALYIRSFPTYELLYGTLATLPILLLWLYLCWCVILLGAELAAALGDVARQTLLSTGDE